MNKEYTLYNQTLRLTYTVDEIKEKILEILDDKRFTNYTSTGVCGRLLSDALETGEKVENFNPKAYYGCARLSEDSEINVYNALIELIIDRKIIYTFDDRTFIKL